MLFINSLFFSELKIFDRPEKPQKADLDTSRLFFNQNWYLLPIKMITI